MDRRTDKVKTTELPLTLVSRTLKAFHSEAGICILTHCHSMTPFDTPGKQGL